jgi:hypothetical protein
MDKLESFYKLVAKHSEVPLEQAKETLVRFEKSCPQLKLEPGKGGKIEAYLMAPKKGAPWHCAFWHPGIVHSFAVGKQLDTFHWTVFHQGLGGGKRKSINVYSRFDDKIHYCGWISASGHWDSEEQ